MLDILSMFLELNSLLIKFSIVYTLMSSENYSQFLGILKN